MRAKCQAAKTAFTGSRVCFVTAIHQCLSRQNRMTIQTAAAMKAILGTGSTLVLRRRTGVENIDKGKHLLG